MADVLKIMDDNFSSEFQKTEAFKTLERVVDEEAQELKRLKQVRLWREREWQKRATSRVRPARALGLFIPLLYSRSSFFRVVCVASVFWFSGSCVPCLYRARTMCRRFFRCVVRCGSDH